MISRARGESRLGFVIDALLTRSQSVFAAMANALKTAVLTAIAQNPRTVQSANLTATRANAGRRELLSLQLSPGTLTS